MVVYLTVIKIRDPPCAKRGDCPDSYYEHNHRLLSIGINNWGGEDGKKIVFVYKQKGAAIRAAAKARRFKYVTSAKVHTRDKFDIDEFLHFPKKTKRK